MKVPVSVVVMTNNEERMIEDCLRSVAEWADEVFVVDSGSTDRTLEIARRYTENLVHHDFETYSRQRNWAQNNLPLRNDWVLHIDADERVTPELAASIRQVFDGPLRGQYHGFMLCRRTVFMGRPILHGGHYPTYQLRLFRRDSGRSEDRLYDAHFVADGPTRMLDGDLIDEITANLTRWTIRHAEWGAAEATQLMNGQADAGEVVPRFNGTPIERRRWLKASLYTRAPLFLRAFGYFFYRYVLRLGFLDGKEGLIFHFLQGFWFRFYIDAKIFEARRLAVPTTAGK